MSSKPEEMVSDLTANDENDGLESARARKLTQHELRQHALQALFTLERREDISQTEAINYALDFEAIINPAFLEQLVAGVEEHLPELDLTIQKYLVADWSLARLTPIDKTILRLGVYEIQFAETPEKVAIDEAINLAHDFSDDAAAKLINGVLTNLIQKNA